MNGGILINERAETTVPGLYAAGEAAGGQHGADRPGGNSLADCQVFGSRAGRLAAERSKRVTSSSPKAVKRIEEQLKSLQNLHGSLNPENLASELAHTMWLNVSVVRSEKTLSEALQKLLKYRRELRSKLRFEEDIIIKVLELRNLIDVGTLITESAILRKETRGSHYRIDYPLRNDKEWLKLIEVSIDKDGVHSRIRKPYMIFHS